MLSQHAPPAKAPESKVQRSSTQGPSRVFERKTQGAHFQAKPQTGLTPLPQGSCSSDWQPSPTPQDPWGHHYQATWEPYPAHTEEWPGDWAPSSPQVEEQISQTYAHPPQTRCPCQKAPGARRTDHPPSRAGKDSPCPTAAIKPAVGPPKPEEREVDAGTQSQEGGDREHEPPPRPGAHPKKCPVQ